jgi:uncharacterized membrane protein (DUF485 family)
MPTALYLWVVSLGLTRFLTQTNRTKALHSHEQRLLTPQAHDGFATLVTLIVFLVVVVQVLQLVTHQDKTTMLATPVAGVVVQATHELQVNAVVPVTQTATTSPTPSRMLCLLVTQKSTGSG